MEALSNFGDAWFEGGAPVILPPKITSALILFAVMASAIAPRVAALRAKSKGITKSKAEQKMADNVVRSAQFRAPLPPDDGSAYVGNISELDEPLGLDDFPEFSGEIPAL